MAPKSEYRYEIQRVFDALRGGRLLSVKSKWPWHVSKIERSFEGDYARSVVDALSRNDFVGNVGRRPCSARLWKALYYVLKGMMLEGETVNKANVIVERWVSLMRTSQQEDVYKTDGGNILLDESESEALFDSLVGDRCQWSVSEAKKLAALLFSWCEANAFTEHTNHQELHGPYCYDGTSSWYVHWFYDLNASITTSLSGIILPFDEAMVVFRWQRKHFFLDVFNNILNTGNSQEKNPIEAYVRFALSSGTPSPSFFSELENRLLRATRWVTSQEFATQAKIYLDGWERRTEPIFGKDSIDLSRVDVREGQYVGYTDMEHYFLSQELA